MQLIIKDNSPKEGFFASIKGVIVPYFTCSGNRSTYDDKTKWHAVGEYLGEGYICKLDGTRVMSSTYHFWKRS